MVLADEEDPNLANLLLREGAQDVLLKSELDSAPLARSLRYAIERQHRVTMMGPMHFEDDLTGVLTRSGFLSLGAHYVHFSRLSRVPLLLASIEISELPKETLEDCEARDLRLLRASEELRCAFEPLMTAGLTETTLEALLNRTALAIENAARVDGRPSGTVRYSIAKIQSEINLEGNLEVDLDEMLGQDGNEFAESAHTRAKTAMLAD